VVITSQNDSLITWSICETYVQTRLKSRDHLFFQTAKAKTVVSFGRHLEKVKFEFVLSYSQVPV